MASARTHVVLPEDLVSAIDKLVGKRGRSGFLARAGWQEVKQQRLLKVLESGEPLWNPEDHPELKRGAAKWVERLRADDEKLRARRHR